MKKGDAREQSLVAMARLTQNQDRPHSPLLTNTQSWWLFWALLLAVTWVLHLLSLHFRQRSEPGCRSASTERWPGGGKVRTWPKVPAAGLYETLVILPEKVWSAFQEKMLLFSGSCGQWISLLSEKHFHSIIGHVNYCYTLKFNGT